VLYTGNENPDWEKLGAEYFIASWERRRFHAREGGEGRLGRGGRRGEIAHLLIQCCCPSSLG
jgi:hypothetical protein